MSDMVCNLTEGRIYKGSIAEVTVRVLPNCFDGTVDDMVVNFYTAEGGASITFSQSDGTLSLSGNNATVVFSIEQLDMLDDGLLKYDVSSTAYSNQFESRFFIKTPDNYTPIEVVTEDELDNKLEDYAKLTDIPSLAGYATEQYVDDKLTGVVTSSTISTIWSGTEDQFDQIATKLNDTLYFIEDD